MENLIKLRDPGAYFFKKPSKIAIRLNRNALIVFHHPTLEGCGMVLHEASHTTRELVEKLDTLLAKTKSHLNGKQTSFEAKIFGLSYYQEILVVTIYQWMKKNKIEISAQDIGRNVRRNVVIDCSTGNVGVRYAENYSAEESATASA
ncbi:MAG: hypothetical protein R3B54_12495 [Bdellovibrionota bacterium]